ncbi:MAG: ribonuclease III [Chitinivibrionales bacterium]|nr:ribonuclease III [Chitinivibrionales bacterium]
MKLLNKAALCIHWCAAIFRKNSNRHRYGELESRLQYHFHDPALLNLALTHKSSLGQDDKTRRYNSNERLEFLGDAVLNCLVTEHLYRCYPTQSEGYLSKIKSLLISRKIIGEIGKAIDLGAYLIMAPSEQRTGGQKRFSIVSNAFEAVVGAVYLDSDLHHVRQILDRMLFARMDSFVNDECNVNYKSKILEMAQADGFGVPQYPVLAEHGPDHDKRFFVGIDIAGVRVGQGSGSNKKLAQQDAAYNATLKYSKEYIVSQNQRSEHE